MRRSVGISILVALAASVFLTGVASAAGPPTSPPGAPTNVKATAGTLAATVVWHAPQSGGTVSTYTVTSNPGSISATVAGPAFSAAVTGLSYGLAYTFTVVATNGAGSGLPSAPSNAVTPDPPGSQFHVTPSYVLFSNTVTAGHPASAYFGEDPVLVPGLTAVAVNVTASQSTADTSVQIVINNQPIQTISLPAGQVVSSLAIVAMPPSLFQASIQVTTGSAHVELDSVGFYTGPKLFRNHGGMFQPLPPAALFSGDVAANSTTSIPVLGQAGIPAANVQAVLLNVTAAGGTAAGSLNLLPSNTRDYGTTSVGFAANQTSVNQVLVGPGRDGAVALLNRGAAVSVLVEILGWVTSPADPTGTGSFYTSTSTTRLVNTASLAPGHPLSFQVRGQGGAPSGTAVAPATSALLQVTVSSPSAAGSVSLFPSSSATGPAEIRFIQGKTASGLIVAPLALDGSESIAISGATANVTVDLVGFLNGDLIVPGTTKKLSASLLAGITSLTATGITFAAGVQASPPIQVNDVINATISPTTPDGFLRRVLSITFAPTGETVLTTRRATLSEALTSFSIDWMLPARKGVFGARAGSVTAQPSGLPPFQPPPGTSIDSNWPVLALVPQGQTLIYPVPIGGLSGEFDITDIELQLVPHFVMKGDPFHGVSFAAGLSLGTKFEASASVLGTVASKTWTPIDQTVKGAFFVIPATPIDIIGRPVFEFKLTIDLTLQAGIIASFHLDKYGLVTAGYDKGFFGNFKGVDYIPDGKMADVKPSLQLEFRPGIHVIPGVEFYGFETIGADLNPYFRITADPFANPWWTVAFGACVHIVEKIDLIILSGEATIDLPCAEQQILAAPSNYIHITIAPPSATVARGATQHFTATTDQNTAHGVLWSILQPKGGTLSNVTVSSVDYTAPTRAGTYELDAAAVDDSTSAASASIIVPAVHPAPPTGVIAIGAPSAAVVTWQVPTDDGGADIASYMITTQPGGATVISKGAANVFVVIGLTPGNTYTFTVVATNAAGLSSVPSAPTAPVTIKSGAGTQALPASIDFGQVAFGQSSPPQTVTVFATSTQDVIISTITLNGMRPQDFSILNDQCSSTTIPAGGACTFQVGYKANVKDISKAFLQINDNDPASLQQSVQLSGFSPVTVTPGFQPVGDAQFTDPQHGFVVDLEGQVWRTSDAGSTWSHVATPSALSTNPTWQPLHFVDNGHGFAVTGSNVYGTADGGSTWSTLTPVPNVDVLTHVWFADANHGWADGYFPTNPLNFLYATTDGGASWVQQQPQLPSPCTTPALTLQAIRFADLNNGWLLGNVTCGGVTTDYAWTTLDGGASWIAHATGVSTRMELGRLQVIDGQHMRVLFSATTGAVPTGVALLTSNDGGATFSILSVDPSAADAFFTNANNGYILSGTRVLVTSDGGHTWAPVGNSAPSPIAMPTPLAQGNAFYSQITVVDATHWWLSGSMNIENGGLIVATSDGGNTWVTQFAGDGSFFV